MSESNNAKTLRDHLFATIQSVRDGTLSPDAAQAVSGVAKQIIDIDRTAIMYMDKIGGTVELGLIDDPALKPREITAPRKPALGYSHQ